MAMDNGYGSGYGVRPLVWQDYVEIWGRRGRQFVAVLLLTICAGLVTVAVLPNVYRSEALVLFEPRISPSYLPTLVQGDSEQELLSLIQETLSRTRLEKLVRDYQLASLQEGRVSDRELLELRERIQIEILRNPPISGAAHPYGFRLAFLDHDPQRAQQVAGELVSFFVAETERLQTESAQKTLGLLGEQIESAKREVSERERQLQEFKLANQGQLPSQERLLVETLTRLQGRMGANEREMERAAREEAVLTAVLEGRTPPPGHEGGGSPRQVQLQTLQNRLVELESRYTPEHPDVVKTREEIAALLRPRPAAGEAGSGGSRATPAGSGDLDSDELRTVHSEQAARQRQQALLERERARYESNLRAVPLRASQLGELEREYDSAREKLDMLLERQGQTELASNAAARVQAGRFRVQDHPSFPLRPYRPNRLRMNALVLAGALVAGVLFAGALELRDRSLKSEADVEYYLGLNNLATIPECLTPMENRMVQARRLLVVGVQGSLVAGTVVLLVFLYALRG